MKEIKCCDDALNLQQVLKGNLKCDNFINNPKNIFNSFVLSQS